MRERAASGKKTDIAKSSRGSCGRVMPRECREPVGSLFEHVAKQMRRIGIRVRFDGHSLLMMMLLGSESDRRRRCGKQDGEQQGKLAHVISSEQRDYSPRRLRIIERASSGQASALTISKSCTLRRDVCLILTVL